MGSSQEEVLYGKIVLTEELRTMNGFTIEFRYYCGNQIWKWLTTYSKKPMRISSTLLDSTVNIQS